MSKSSANPAIQYKAATQGAINLDEAKGIVECFVAGIGNKDSVGDVCAPGAFSKSLLRRKPRVVWGHNWNDPIGKVLEIYEVPPNDPRLPGKMRSAGIGGLYAKVQFNLMSEKGKEAFANVAFFGEEQEWSIGYKTINAKFDQQMQANVLYEVELYEVSPVLHGANQLTGTISVKSDEGSAVAVMERAVSSIAEIGNANSPELKEVLDALKKIASSISDDEKCGPGMPTMPRPSAPASMPSVPSMGPAPAPRSVVKPTRPSIPENPMVVALRRELVARTGSNIIVRSAGDNVVVFDRVTSDGSSSTYRLAYHYANGEFMFGKPEKVSAQTVYTPEVPGAPGDAYWGDDYSEMPKSLASDDFWGDGFGSEINIPSVTSNALMGVIESLQQIIDEKSEYVIPVEPTEAFEFKQMIDPVLEYYKADARVTEEGIVVKSAHNPELIEALDVATKSVLGKIRRGIGAGRRLDAPNIGGGKGRSRAARAIGAATGGVAGNLDPSKISLDDPDGDGWAREGSKNPVWVGFKKATQKLTGGKKKPAKDNQRLRSAVNADRPGPPRPSARRAWDAPSTPAPPRPSRVTLTDDAGAKLRELGQQRARELGFDRNVDPALPRPRKKLTNQVTRAPRPGEGGRKPSGESIASAIRRSRGASNPVLGQELANDVAKYGYPEEMSTDDLVRTVGDFRRQIDTARKNLEQLRADRDSGKKVSPMDLKQATQKVDSLRQRATVYSSEVTKRDRVKGSDRFSSGKAVTPEAKRMRRHAPIGTTGEFDLPDEIAAREKHEAFVEEFRKQNGFWRDIPRAGTLNSMNTSEEWQRAREVAHNVATLEWEETELNRRPKGFNENARSSVDYLTWYGNFAQRMGRYLDREESSENISDDELSGARAAILDVLAEKRAVPGSPESIASLEKMMADAGFGPGGRHETAWGGRKRTSVTGFSSGKKIDRNVMQSLKDDGMSLSDDDVVAVLLPNSGIIVHKTLNARGDDSSLNWKVLLGDSKVEPKSPTSPRAMIRLDADGFQKLSDAMDAANSEFVPSPVLQPYIKTVKDKDFPYSYPPSTRFSSGKKYPPEIEDELIFDSELGGNRAADRINTQNVDMEIVPASDMGLDGPEDGAWTVVGMYRGEDYGSVDYIYETDTFDSVEEARRFIETYDRLIEEEIRPEDPEFFLDIDTHNKDKRISLDDDLDTAIEKAARAKADRENAPVDYGSLLGTVLADRSLNLFGDGESRFSSGRNKIQRRGYIKDAIAEDINNRKLNLEILSRRMSGETLDDVGRSLGIDRGTIRQMEMREMKRLRDGATPSEILAYRMTGLTLDDMGRMLGMSREDVRRIESREIARMRNGGRDGSDAIFEGRKAGLSRESIEKLTGLSLDEISSSERKGFERAVTRQDVSNQIFDKYVTRFGENDLTDAELAEELGVSEKIVSEVREKANKDILDARRSMDEHYASLPEPTDEELQAEADYYADKFAQEQGFGSYGEYKEYIDSIGGKDEWMSGDDDRLSSGLVRQMTIENPLLIGALAGIATSKIQRRRRERLDEDDEYGDDDEERFSSGAGRKLTPSEQLGQRIFDEALKIAKEDKKDIFETMDALIYDERFDALSRGEKIDTDELYRHIGTLLHPQGRSQSKKRRLWRRDRFSSGNAGRDMRKKKRSKAKQRAWSEEDLQRFRDRNILKAKTRPGKRKDGPSAEEFSSGRKRIDTAGSSALTGAFYDADNERLVVGFNKGGVYAYEGVTPADIEELHNATSKGAAMASIKKKYKGSRLSSVDDSFKATKQGDEWIINPDNETTYSISEDGGEFFVLRTSGSYAKDGAQSGEEYYHPESFKNMDSAMKWVEQDSLPTMMPDPSDEEEYDVDRFSSGGPVRYANQMQFDTRRSRRASNMTYDPQDGRVGITYNDGSERFFSEVPYEVAKAAGSPSKNIDDFIDDLERGKVGKEGGRFSSGASSVPRTDWDYSYQKFPPTEEQAVIADAVATGENVIVRAFAGTGKTSTLVTIAERLKRQDPKKRIVYMAFNKDIQLEAEGRFPGNTESRTGDSISWNWVKQTMGEAFTKRMGNDAPERVKSKGTRNKDIAVHFKIKQMEHPDGLKDDRTGSPVVLDSVDVTKLVREAVKQFLISEDDEIGAQHFKTIQNVPPVLLGHAKAIWDDMNDPNGVMKLDNAVFTKMWALSRPQLSDGVGLFKGKPSVIFFDEAQDINPVMAKVMREQNIQVVFVGDSYQAIYGFRGASDSLEKAEATYDLPLTGSWRFDSKIAGYANRFLAYMGSKNRIRGVGKPGNGVVEPESMVDPDAILTRSNGGALRAVVEQIRNGRVVGTSENFKKDLTRFAWHAVMLKAGKPVRNPHEELEEFSSWQEVMDAASAEDANPRLRMLVQLFNDTPNIIEVLDQVVVGGKLRGESGGGGSGKRILPSEVVDGFETSIDPGSMGKWAKDKKAAVTYKNGKLFFQLPYTKKGTSDDDSKKDWIRATIGKVNRPNYGYHEETGGKFSIYIDATPEEAANFLSGLTTGEAQEVDVMVMTAHRSKGLEFGRVQLYGDFPRPRLNKKTNEMEYPTPEEQRLQYVASTRAIRELDPGPTAWIYDETSDDDESPEISGGFSSGAKGNPMPSAIGKDMVLEDGGTLEDNMFKGTYVADFNGGKMVIQPAGRDSWAVYRADFSGGEDGPSYNFSYGPPSDDAEFGSLADAYEHVLNYVKENDISLDPMDGSRKSKGSESFSEAKVSNPDSGIAQRFSSGRKAADKRLKEARKSSSRKGDKSGGKDSRIDRAVDAYLNYVFGADKSSRLSSGSKKQEMDDANNNLQKFIDRFDGWDDEDWEFDNQMDGDIERWASVNEDMPWINTVVEDLIDELDGMDESPENRNKIEFLQNLQQALRDAQARAGSMSDDEMYRDRIERGVRRSQRDADEGVFSSGRKRSTGLPVPDSEWNKTSDGFEWDDPDTGGSYRIVENLDGTWSVDHMDSDGNYREADGTFRNLNSAKRWVANDRVDQFEAADAEEMGDGVPERDEEDIAILADYYMTSYGGYDDDLGNWLDNNPGKTADDYLSSPEFAKRVDDMENVMADAGDALAERRLDEYSNRRFSSGARGEKPSDEEIYNLRMSGPTLEEVGDKYGMTRQEVRAAEMRHIRKMREDGFEQTGGATSRRERRLSSGAGFGGRTTRAGSSRQEGKVVLSRKNADQTWSSVPENYLKPEDDFFDNETASRILDNPLENYNDQTGWPVPAKRFFQSLVLKSEGREIPVMDEDGKFTPEGRNRIKKMLFGPDAQKEKFLDAIESGETSHMQAVSAKTMLEKIGMDINSASDHMFDTFGFESAPVWISGLDARDPEYDLIRGETNWTPLSEEQWLDEVKQAYVENPKVTDYGRNFRQWLKNNKGKSEQDYESSPEFERDAKRAYLLNRGGIGPAEVYSHPYAHFYSMRENQKDAVRKNWLSNNPGKTDEDYEKAMSWGGDGDPDLSPEIGGWGFGDPRKMAGATPAPAPDAPSKRPSTRPSTGKSSLPPDTTKKLFGALKVDAILSALGIADGTNREQREKLSELVGFEIKEDVYKKFKKGSISPRAAIELLRRGHIKNLDAISAGDRTNDDLRDVVDVAKKGMFTATVYGRLREAAREAGLSDDSFGMNLWKRLGNDMAINVIGRPGMGQPRSSMADGPIPATFNLSKTDLLGEDEISALVDGLNEMAEAEGSSARFTMDEIFPKDSSGGFIDAFGESKIRMSSGASTVRGQRFVAKPKENRLTSAAKETAEMRFSSAARPTYRTPGGGIDKDAMSADIDDAIRGPRLGAVAITTANADNIGREQIDNLARAITLRQHIADMFPSVVNDRTGVSYDIEPLLIEQGLDPKDAEKLTDLVNDLDGYIDGIVAQFEEEGDKLEDGLRRMDDMLDEVESLRKYRKETIEKYGEDDARNLVARLDDKINKLTTSIDEEYQATIGSNRTNMAKLRDEALALVDDNPGFEKPKAGSDGPRLSSGANSLSSKLVAIEMAMGRSAEGGLPKYTPVSKIDFNVPSGTRLSSGKADEWYGNLTAKLIEQIEKVQASGGDKWEFPWHRTTSMPKNGVSGHVFSGMNPFHLMLAAEEKGYTSNKWATYNQWQGVGGQVRKGEKGVYILAPVFKKVKDPDTGKEETKLVNWRTYAVFNLEQIDGINPDDYKDDPKDLLDEAARVERVDKAFSSIGAEIETGDGSSAHYSPSKDKVVMPPFAYFKTPEGYYATLGHELVHWTGHSSRLDRPNMNRFGTPEYAREELVAELGAAFLMANFGLTAEPREDHAHYLANWLKVLREEPRALQEAAREAQKASKMLIEKMREVLGDVGVAEETLEDVSGEKSAWGRMFEPSESELLLEVAGVLPAYLRQEVQLAIKSATSNEVPSTKVINRVSKTIELLEMFSKQKGI